MKKRIVLLWLLALGMTYGQDETTNWYFGINAGLRFNEDGSVTALSEGKIRTEEGCASISNAQGELLFYTDGITIYNGGHEVITGGTGLYGDPSSTQSAIIVPGSKTDDLFYVFTVDTSIRDNDRDFGLNYSVVDMSGNDGKGAVVRKNINLLRSCSEKITAVAKDCVKESFWVVTLASESGGEGPADTFHAFEVNEQGVVENAVKSKLPEQFQDPRGYLKISPDGHQLASANERDGLFLYNFDAGNGRVSNPRRIAISTGYRSPYGIEFSPNNRYLYVHAHSGAPPFEDNHNANLLQYDLSAENISLSQTVLYRGPNYRGALQLAANGKIYVTLTQNYQSGTQYLGVVHNPDQGGAEAAYEHNAVFLDEGIAMQGLPPFIQSFFAKKGLLTNSDGSTSSAGTACLGEPLVLETEPLPGATYEWTFNGTPFVNDSGHLLQLDNVDATVAGQYRLVITPSNAAECQIIGEANVQVSAPPMVNSGVLEQCDIDENGSDGFTLFNLNQAISELSDNSVNTLAFYENLRDLSDEIPISEPGRYRNTDSGEQTLYVTVTDIFGCSNETELVLRVNASVSGPISGGVLYTCSMEENTSRGRFALNTFVNETYPDYEVTLFADREDAQLEINPLPRSNDYISAETVLYARIEIQNQCLGVEQLALRVNLTPVVTLEKEYQLCTNSPNLFIAAEEGFNAYRWYRTENGNPLDLVSEDSVFQVLEPGTYRLEVDQSYAAGREICTANTYFTVVPSNSAAITDIINSDFLENNRVEVIVQGDGDYEYSLESVDGPFQDDPVFENVSPGSRTLYVRDKNGCGIAQEAVSIIGFPKFFSPNGDGKNDSWELIGVSGMGPVMVSIFDRYGTLLYEGNLTDGNGWNGTFNGRLLPASDYWFRIRLEDGTRHNGHFTLKR